MPTTWETLPPGVRIIGEDDLRRVGDLDEVLGEFYDDALRAAAVRAGRPERRLRTDIERVFITPGGTRGTAYRGPTDTNGIPNAAIDELEQRHLLRAERRAGALWYELTHDRLIDPIRHSNARATQHRARRARRRLAVAGVGALLAATVVGVVVGTQSQGDRPAAVVVITESSKVVVSASIPVGSQPSHVAVGAGLLWVTNTADDTVSEINPVSGLARRTRVGDRPTGIAANDTNVWVTDQGADTVTKLNAVDPGSGKQRIIVGDEPGAVAVSNGVAWVANSGSDSVTRIASDGTTTPRSP